MKKSILFLFVVTAIIFSSCEEKLPLYSDPQAYLNFDIRYREDTLINYSFAFADKGVNKDTVWITLNTMGYLSDKPRTFKLKQIPFGKLNAEPGKHYLGFDTKEMKKYLVIPAKAVSVDVPIVLFKHSSLDKGIYNLRIQVQPNGTFMPGYQEQNFVQIAVTNKLSRPSEWNGFMEHYFGKWGEVKHKFMMRITGYKWDDKFIRPLYKDQAYARFLQSKLKRALDKLNEERKAKGESFLKEENGSLITFDK